MHKTRARVQAGHHLHRRAEEASHATVLRRQEGAERQER